MPSSTLSFLERPPKKRTEEKAPVLFLIHGYGASDADLFGFADYLPDHLHIFSLNAPHALPMGGFAWYSLNFDAAQSKVEDIEQARESLVLIENFIDDTLKKYPVDRENVTLFGFSQGAILSYALGLNTPKITNVLALSGYLNENLLKTPTHTKTRFFISHGTEDQIILFDWARKAPETLEKLNIKYTFKSYPMGHGIAPDNFEDIQQWIQKNI